ncbi:phosphoprotein phosphatase [Tritrichomonas foetus]|uniref:Phosphoprotein phosphatase n=1 Tax=Tritrichomonas foetus TaxID=1144522 RepID=A0A1J4L061_9EUKA|nr:phosphoprotein phosphatase [Tritrichomonas foetus]|eukprot:OHT16802.1 phosphoprotein phosphatase [Tritrichomonas foetus]
MLLKYTTRKSSAISLIKKNNMGPANLIRSVHFTLKTETLPPMDQINNTKNNSTNITSKTKGKISDRKDEPTIDTDIPMVFYTIEYSRKKNHKDLVVEKYPPLPVMFAKEYTKLLEMKIKLCSILCDFSDPEADKDAKTTKTNTLQELFNVVSIPSNHSIFSDPTKDIFFSMIKTNLSRGIPPIHKKLLFSEEEPPIVDVNWPHLALIYQSLMKYYELSPNDERFNASFIKMMISLTRAPDMNEREYIVSFFKAYLNSHPEKENGIFKEMAYLLIGYREKQYEPFCVTTILKIYLARFQLDQKANEFHTAIFLKAILPLIHTQHIFAFYPLFGDIFDLFINLDQSLATKIILQVIKAWPSLKPSKQLLFINLLNFMVERVPLPDFIKVSHKIFQLYATIAQLNMAKVVEESLKIWNNVRILPMILECSRKIFPIVFPAYNRTSKFHWNNKTQNALFNALKSMHDADPFVFDELVNKNKRTRENSQGSNQKNWAMIARMASKVDRTINLASTLAEIQIKFNENPRTEMTITNKSTPNLLNIRR